MTKEILRCPDCKAVYSSKCIEEKWIQERIKWLQDKVFSTSENTSGILAWGTVRGLINKAFEDVIDE